MLSAVHRALLLPEVLCHIASFLTQNDALTCVLVSRAWLQAFQPILWSRVETANDISPQDMVRHAHYIRTLSLSDLEGLEEVLENCTRLETLILWPDTFKDEEDEEDEDEEHVYHEESLFASSLPIDVEQQPLSTPQPAEKYEQAIGSQLHVTGSIAQESKLNSSVGEDNAETEHTSQAPEGGSEAGVSSSTAPTTSTATAATGYGHDDYDDSPKARLTNLLIRNPHLTRLELCVEHKSPGGSFWHALAGPPPPSTPSDSLPPSSTLQKTRSACPRLCSLQSLANLQVYKHVHLFFNVCTRLESLELERCSLRQLDESYYSTLLFPRLKEVKFRRIRDTSLYCQLLILKRCPELRSLEWRVPRLGLPVSEFCEALREGCWKKLHSLVLPESRLTDQELAQILWSTNSFSEDVASPAVHYLRQPNSILAGAGRRVAGGGGGGGEGQGDGGLTRFEARRSDFAGESFRALKGRGHFRTLRQLDLFQCTGLESWMTVEILNECPLLENFDGRQIFAHDIVYTQSSRMRHQSGQGSREKDGHESSDDGWACKSLRYLELHITGFIGDGSEQDVAMQRQVFRKLAQLEQLVYLSIGGRSSSRATVQQQSTTATAADSTTLNEAEAVRTREGGLELRLGSGLSQLATLRRLRMLRFSGSQQQMTMEDVEWMINNLPELKIVQGRLHSDPQEQENLEKILERGRISTWSVYHRQERASSL